jgi:hypothetical protein
MSVTNKSSLKKMVGMLIEVLHGEYQDTRDLAVVQLSIFDEKAVPYISSFLEGEAEKERDMIKYFELYKTWSAQNCNLIDFSLCFLLYCSDIFLVIGAGNA